MAKFYLKMLNLWVLLAVLLAALGQYSPSQAQAPNYLHTEGSKLIDSHGNQVTLTGINWFGLETESYAPHGLWARSWESMLDQIVELGFNTIRLPYSNQLLDASSAPNGIDYGLNPDLEGLSGLEIMDKIIAGAGERGLKVILDRHRPDSHSQSELWYTDQYSEERWISDWVMLASRYAGNDTVIGADLHNEPHGQATWGTDDQSTDWRLAAERAGNAILAANPDWLIIVQGVDHYQDNWYWWGGNLLGARDHPVRLDVPDRLVYSTHVYGPGVYPQPWFWEDSFPDNLPAIWDRYWGYLEGEGIAPVIVGEFGGRSVGEDKEGVWQRTLVSYMREHNLNYMYWTLNPNSGDTGGVLLDDWQTVDPDKQALLSGYQFPILGIEQRGPEPAAQLPAPAPSVTGTLRLSYRTAEPAEQTQNSKPEFIVANTGSTPVPLESVELSYWLDDSDDQNLVFHCDWAQIGCANVLGDFQTSSDGTRYLRIRFKPGQGPLLPGQATGEIKVRFNRADWSEFRQADHYSFTVTTDYIDWDRVTLSIGDQVVWGVGPGSGAAPPPTNTPVAPTLAPSPTLPVPSPTSPEPTATPTQVELAQASTPQPTQLPAATVAPAPPAASSSSIFAEPVVVAGLLVASGLTILAISLVIVFFLRRPQGP
jgi:endoglucanase